MSDLNQLINQPTDQLHADTIKACCTAVYQNEWVRYLIGDSFHPGGLALTGQLGGKLGLGPKSRVLDVASGAGTSALFLAERFGCQVVGVELSAKSVAQANETAVARQLDHLVQFKQGDAENLPFPHNSFDAVICECALCTFPNKAAAAAEFARVLRPGGQLGFSDLTRDGRLPIELDSLLGWVACIADAQPLRKYEHLLTEAGFVIRETALHNRTLTEMIRAIQGKLLGAELLLTRNKPALPGFDFTQAKQLAQQAGTAVRAGRLGYAVILAQI